MKKYEHTENNRIVQPYLSFEARCEPVERVEITTMSLLLSVGCFAAVANVQGSDETWQRFRKLPCRTNADGRLSSCQ
jgi:hypothetical protein